MPSAHTLAPVTALALALFLLLLSPVAAAVRLSVCQGNFEAIRGPDYRYQASGTLPAQQMADIEAGASAIYRHWQELLAAPVPFVVDVRLELLRDPARFKERKLALAPELPEVTGFFSWESRVAVALVDPRRPQENRRRALHEVSHMVTVSQLGGAPHWLAEGLAEVHEMIQLTPQGLMFADNQRHRRWLSAEQDLSLRGLMSAPQEAWLGPDSQRLYALSWSLVHFLLQTPEGRGALGFTLQQASTHSCGSYDASRFLAQAYPGGGVALQRDWARWLGSV